MKIRINASDPDKMVFRLRYHRKDPRPNVTVSVMTLGNPKEAIRSGLAKLAESTLVLAPRTE